MTAPRLTLALLGAVLALLLAEALARLHGDHLCLETPGVVYQTDARYGWSHVPGLSGWVGTCRTPRVPMVPIDADEHGLLGPERPYLKPPETARILLLGGNGPEGLGVMPTQSVARLLEAAADRRRGARLEVINAATGGFVLDNDLLFFRTEGRRYAPDLVLVVLDPTSELAALSPRLIYVSGQNAPVKPSFRLEGDRLVDVPSPAPAAEAMPVVTGGLARLQLFRLWQDLPRRQGPALGFTQGEAPAEGITVDIGAERQRAGVLARALLTALRDETRATGATLVAAIGPIRQGAWDPDGGQDDQILHDMAAGLGVPTVDLGRAFRGGEHATAQVYLPGSGRWGRDGHFIASQAIWHFLVARRLLPAGVVPVVAVNGGQQVDGRTLVPVVRDLLWRERYSTAARFVLFGLLATAVVWMGAVLPPVGREWLAVVAGVGVVAALGARGLAPAAVVIAVGWYAALELLPARGAVPALAVLAAVALVGPLLWTLPTVAGVERDGRLFFALASGVALLRLLAYAVDRRRHGAPRRPLREFLGALFFFPVLLFGPIEAPEEHLARRVPGGLAPASFAALGAHLGRSALGLGRLAFGGAKLALAVAALDLVGPDVWMTAGRAVSRGRLWLWMGELPLYLYALASGISDVAIGLAAMVGVRVTENFRQPWAARDAAAFWRRWQISLGAWLHRYVYQPLGSDRRRVLAIGGAFAASVLWHVWLAAAFFQPTSRVVVPVGFLLWGAMNAAAVAAVHRWPGRAVGLLSLAVVLLSWLPFSLPPGLGLRTCAGILLYAGGAR